jgi:hypothetical protein
MLRTSSSPLVFIALGRLQTRTGKKDRPHADCRRLERWAASFESRLDLILGGMFDVLDNQDRKVAPFRFQFEPQVIPQRVSQR